MNIIESLLNKYTGYHLTGAEREANKFNSEQAAMQRQFQREMYEQYNSPSAMMAQYQDAGLNPALMYGESANMPMANSSSNIASSVSPGSSDIVGALSSLVQLRSELDLKRAQARELNSNANLKEIEAKYEDERIQTQIEKDKNLAFQAASATRGMDIDNEYKDAINDWAIQNSRANYNLKTAQTDETYARIDKIMSENEEVKERTKKISVEIAEITEHIILMQSQEELTEAQAKEVGAKIQEINANIGKLASETHLNEKDLEMYVWNHSKQVTTRYGMGTQSTAWQTPDGEPVASTSKNIGSHINMLLNNTFGPMFKW